MRRLVFVIAWFFLVRSKPFSGPFTIVGPFQTLADCQTYRANVAKGWGVVTYQCWTSGGK
jgi:hypothetical protein